MNKVQQKQKLANGKKGILFEQTRNEQIESNRNIKTISSPPYQEVAKKQPIKTQTFMEYLLKMSIEQIRCVIKMIKWPKRTELKTNGYTKETNRRENCEWKNAQRDNSHINIVPLTIFMIVVTDCR